MGYRSEVCIAMSDDASRLFRTILEHLPEKHEVRELVKDAQTSYHSQPWGDQHKKPDVDCESRMYWDHVKWYEGFECIDMIESFLVDCIPEECYRFVRIGEEMDDSEDRGDFWDAEISIQRTISW